jgi:hypothetical protein
MNLTTSQIFQIGSIVAGAFALGSNISGFGLAPGVITAVTSAAGLFLIIWNGVGAVVTGQASQAKEVSEIRGLKVEVDTAKASNSLVAMARDTAVENVVVKK